MQSLQDAQGQELMSDGDPAFWRGRAPLLFPIVGRLNEDTLRLDGAHFTMQKHGFARKSMFELIEHEKDTALFRLTDTPQTREYYPFAFELDARFHLAGTELAMVVTVRNTGDVILPFSFGFHPAFAWPLPSAGFEQSAPRGEHEIIFEADEPAHLCRVTPYGTIAADPVPSPVAGRSFRLNDGLFEDDALVWKDLTSRSLTYGAHGKSRLHVRFPDLPMLGIWTKPGARFICIEPWAGMADPEGYDGDFMDKPGILTLPPCAEQGFNMHVQLMGSSL
jgi:galactose mutarotase-like enzyme